MDTHTFHLLEMDELKEIIASHSICELGQRGIRDLPVLTSREKLIKEFEKISEMISILVSTGELPTEGITDIEGLVERVSVANSHLDPQEFIQIFNFLSATMNIRSMLEDLGETYPVLLELTKALIPMPTFKRMIRDTFDSKGEIKDDATDELKEIRQRKRDLARRIDGTLDKYLNDPNKKLFLQEVFITERNYRKVLPVKIEFKHHIKGIIHAYSITEETAFIEPMEVVEMSNELMDIIVEEEKEVKRILVDLADYLREKLDALRTNLETISEIDGLYARAKYARKHGCNVPDINDTGEIVILEGRHPLLMESIGERCIPLSLKLTAKDRVLTISGPNAGGKTTAVKTIGILALMAQSAIPIPAKKESSLPIMTDFYADIGDEQSLAEGISTFSSHMKQIKAILENATEGSLIILDELGTGTDPAEGALLAQAILEELAQRSTTTLVTSHLMSLKTLDRTKEWARTASFSLDPTTEVPNFILSMDIPGESNALQIAKLLGLPENIVERARELMSPEERQLKDVVDQVKREQAKYEELRRGAEKERREIIKSRERYYGLIDELEVEKSKIKEVKLKQQKEIVQEKKKSIAEAKKRIERLIADLPSKKDILRARDIIADEQEQLDKEAVDIEKKLSRQERGRRVHARMKDLKPGMRVFVQTLRGHGTVKRLYENQKKVDVTFDGLDFNLSVKQVFLPDKNHKEAPPPELHTSHVTRAPRISSNDLNLVGKRVDVALEELDKFIDDAFLSGFDTIRVIHGLGTGALRDAVRNWLSSHPRIVSYRQGDRGEGGFAVTVAQVS